MELTIEQRRAKALASARLRMAAGGADPASFKPKAEEWGPPGAIVPIQFKKGTGEMRLAVPQIITDIGNAFAAPGNALRGKYDDVLADPETGAVEPFNRQMMGDAATLAGVPLLGSGGMSVTAAKTAAGEMPAGARSLIARALKDDGIPVNEVGPRMRELGPDTVLADLGPRLQKQAQAIATMPGPGQKTVLDALRLRAAGRDSRIASDVDASLGPAPIPSAVKSTIRQGQDALSPYYERAMEGATRVDTSPIALNLDSAIVNLRGEAQSVAKKIRGMLNVVGAEDLDPSPRTLFEIRKAIDGMFDTVQDRNARAVLTETRKAVDDLLAQAAPGIKEIDAMFSELAKQGGALDEGGMLLAAGKEARHPSDVVEQMLAGANPEGLAVGPSAVPFRLSQGARAEIDRLFGTKANDLQALKQAVGGEGDWNRAKLAAVFGPEKADRLLSIITREMRYKTLEDDALGGSRTQVLRAAQEEIGGKTASGPGIVQSLLNIQPGTAAARAADKGLGWIGRSRRTATNAAVADALMSGQQSEIARQLLQGGSGAVPIAVNASARGTLIERDKLNAYVDELLGRNKTFSR